MIWLQPGAVEVIASRKIFPDRSSGGFVPGVDRELTARPSHENCVTPTFGRFKYGCLRIEYVLAVIRVWDLKKPPCTERFINAILGPIDIRSYA